MCGWRRRFVVAVACLPVLSVAKPVWQRRDAMGFVRQRRVDRQWAGDVSGGRGSRAGFGCGGDGCFVEQVRKTRG